MSEISNYILTIAGVILISVVIELVMSDGGMNKYIKSIFAFFTIGVIIAPLPNLLSTDKLTSIFELDEYEIQGDYISALTKSKMNVLINETQLELGKEGYSGIILNVLLKDGEISILEIKLKDLIIEENAEHKDIEKIKQHISEKVVKKFEIVEEKIKYEN